MIGIGIINYLQINKFIFNLGIKFIKFIVNNSNFFKSYNFYVSNLIPSTGVFSFKYFLNYLYRLKNI